MPRPAIVRLACVSLLSVPLVAVVRLDEAPGAVLVVTLALLFLLACGLWVASRAGWTVAVALTVVALVPLGDYVAWVAALNALTLAGLLAPSTRRFVWARPVAPAGRL